MAIHGAQHLNNAQNLAVSFPEEYTHPSPADLTNLQIGDWVQVRALSESFWVELITANSDLLVGWIDNHLHLTDRHGLRHYDFLEFDQKHVFSIKKLGR